MPRWQPGRSGNPGGRPRVIREVRELAREHADCAIAVLVEIMSNRKMPPGCRISAATHLLDRAYGRPPQEQHLVVQDTDPFEDDVMTALAELRRLKKEPERKSMPPRRDEDQLVPDDAQDEVDLETFRRSFA